MNNTITLNEKQMNLLKEFVAAEHHLSDTSDLMVKATDVDYEKVSSMICDAFYKRDKAACYFAASVAEEVANA